MEEDRIQSTEAGLRKQFGGEDRMCIALEAGTRSPLVSRLLSDLAHEVLVANPRKIQAITASESKSDRHDAEKLARFAACDPKLLSPIPPALQPACLPLVEQIAQLNLSIAWMDREEEALGSKYPEIPLLRTPPGVSPGPLRAGLGAAPMESPTGCERRRPRQEARHGRCSSQAGRAAAQHVAQAAAVRTVS